MSAKGLAVSLPRHRPRDVIAEEEIPNASYMASSCCAVADKAIPHLLDPPHAALVTISAQYIYRVGREKVR